MFENTTVRGQSKPVVFRRQNSRQGPMLRPRQVPIGKWHLKSLLVAAVILVVVLYYAHRTDEQTGVQAHKRDLVARPAKPYKSPARRRHSKPHKDGKDVQPLGKSVAANASLILNKPIADFKHNKPKILPALQAKITANRAPPTVSPQNKTRYNTMHKDGALHELSPFVKVSHVKIQPMDTFRDSLLKGDKKQLPINSPEGTTDLPSTKTQHQRDYKMHVSKDDMVPKSTQSPNVLRYLKNNNNDNLHILKPLLHEVVHEDVKNKPDVSGHKNYVLPRPVVIPKQVMKMRGSMTN
ncbi:hypothetical protein BsWGS_00171 [Bradybaena similaris]